MQSRSFFRFWFIPAMSFVLWVLAVRSATAGDYDPCENSGGPTALMYEIVFNSFYSLNSDCYRSRTATHPIVSILSSPQSLGPTMALKAKTQVPAAGDVLIIGGHGKTTTAIEFYDPNNKSFALTGLTGGPAAAPSVELTKDGSILSMGGLYLAKPQAGQLPANQAKHYMVFSPSTSAQLYNFKGGTAAATAGNALNIARAGYTTTLIAGSGTALDGQVLIAGGFDITTGKPVNTAEIYDPTTQTFTLLANSMTDHRALHTATLLSNGSVLIAGGIDRVAEVLFGLAASAVSTNTAEIFSPATQTFTALTSTLPQGVAAHTATVLQDNKILFTGGFNITPDPFAPFGVTVNAAAIYDPGTQTFTTTGNLTDDRMLHTATLLPSGQVLITGGLTTTVSWTIDVATSIASIQSSGSAPRNTAELYDPNSGTFTCVKGSKAGPPQVCLPSMTQARAGHSATLFSSGPLVGQVLIAGGWSKSKIESSAELYNPAATKTSTNGGFTKTGSMKTGHTLHSAILLQ